MLSFYLNFKNHVIFTSQVEFLIPLFMNIFSEKKNKNINIPNNLLKMIFSCSFIFPMETL